MSKEMTQHDGQEKPDHGRLSGPVELGEFEYGPVRKYPGPDNTDIILLRDKPDEMRNNWMGFICQWEGKTYVTTTNQSHARSGLKVLRYVLDQGGSPPDHFDLMGEPVRFTVKMDGADRLFLPEYPEKDWRFEEAAKVLQALGVDKKNIKYDGKVLAPRML